MRRWALRVGLGLVVLVFGGLGLEPDSGPGATATADRIVADVRQHVRAGSILLLHVWYASGAASRAAVPGIIDTLRADGYRFSTAGELLARASRTAS